MELSPETEYTISITGGANGVKEVFGGALAEDIDITFTTCNDTGPAGQVRVGISTNPYNVLSQVDDTGTAPANELCTGGYTPIGGTLIEAQDYLRSGGSPTETDDPRR